MTEISYREMVEALIGMHQRLDILTDCLIELSDSVNFTIRETIKARLDSCQMMRDKSYQFVGETRKKLEDHEIMLAGLTKKRDSKSKYD